MKNFTNILLFLIIAGFISCRDDDSSSIYRLVWDTPSKNTYETMPLGNGEVAANVWIDEAGNLRFYISRIDAIDENGQLLKVGALRISPDRPVPAQSAFRQTLDVKRGVLEAVYGDLAYKFWIDANRNVIVAEITTKTPQAVTAFNEGWRNERTKYDSYECSDLYNFCSSEKPSFREIYRERFDNRETVIDDMVTVIEPDAVLDLPDAIGWYHRNIHSKPYQITAEVQGTDDLLSQDPLLHRTFGAIVRAEQGKKTGEKTLQSPAGTAHRFEIAVHAKHPATAQEWLRETEQMLADAQKMSSQKRFAEHAKWWDDFCNRSWIHITPNENSAATDSGLSDAFVLSRAYFLQRYVSACAGRGQMAIKFNGSIFTVPEQGKQGNADYRRWGPGYWWQNTRLPYFAMPAAGDFDMMLPFFNQYFDILPLCSNRVKKYFGHGGAYYPECIYFWGDVFLETYGWESWKERTDKLQKSGYHKYEWVSGLELACMMLEYYEYTEDAVFLNTKAIPLAMEVLTFFSEHYSTGPDGKLFMSPSQSLETWWDCDDPMPELAGMYAVTERLERLPENTLTAERKKFVSELKQKLPKLPLIKSPNNKMMLAPARRFEQCRNVENPELYAVFPFRLISYEKPDAELGIEAFRHRKDRGAFGWRQDDIFASYLGLTDEARNHLVQRAKNKHKASRFPVFWGPNYDWIPDQDHGGILTKGVQSLVMQCDGKRIDIFPAFPADWDCDFKLRAPYNTTVEGKLKNGKLQQLKVTPKERMKDIRNMLENR
ncbi:MAG: DUF5703 domain-containing protein [Prevotellaceae bacterium]|jgi:hypothetical protein|nr:DUF5703 domain-containing protein [Prevotellaceae bacterium]